MSDSGRLRERKTINVVVVETEICSRFKREGERVGATDKRKQRKEHNKNIEAMIEIERVIKRKGGNRNSRKINVVGWG